MKINETNLAQDMLQYMEAVRHREIYREGTTMYEHHNQTIEYIENEWRETLESVLWGSA